MLNDDERAKLRELTIPIREETLERTVGSLPRRLIEPLDKLLELFVTMNPIGNMCGYAHLAHTGLTPPSSLLDEDETKPFNLYIWCGVTTAMMSHAMKPLMADVRSGFEAASDRLCVDAYTPWYEDATDPAALGRRLDTAAFAYLIGASIAWAGRTATSPKHIQFARAGVARLSGEDRRLLHDRYERRLSVEQIARRMGVGVRELPNRIAEVLELAVGACNVA